MFENLLKVKTWNDETLRSFYNELYDFFDEDKCAYVCDVSKELLSRGGSKNLRCAEEMLLFCEDNFFNTDDSDCKAAVYYRLAKLYEEEKEDFSKAYEYYEKYSLANTKFGGTACILTKALLLKDGFTYSDELEKELLRSYGEPDLGLRNDRFYETAANLIVARHNGKEDEAKNYRKQLLAIVKSDELLFLDIFFKKDDIRDVLSLPAIAKEFVNSLKDEIEAEKEAEKAAEKAREEAEKAQNEEAENAQSEKAEKE